MDPAAARQHDPLFWELHKGRRRHKDMPIRRSTVATRSPWYNTTTSRLSHWSAGWSTVERDSNRLSSWRFTYLTIRVCDLSQTRHIANNRELSPATENKHFHHHEVIEFKVMLLLSSRQIGVIVILNTASKEMKKS